MHRFELYACVQMSRVLPQSKHPTLSCNSDPVPVVNNSHLSIGKSKKYMQKLSTKGSWNIYWNFSSKTWLWTDTLSCSRSGQRPWFSAFTFPKKSKLNDTLQVSTSSTSPPSNNPTFIVIRLITNCSAEARNALRAEISRCSCTAHRRSIKTGCPYSSFVTVKSSNPVACLTVPEHWFAIYTKQPKLSKSKIFIKWSIKFSDTCRDIEEASFKFEPLPQTPKWGLNQILALFSQISPICSWMESTTFLCHTQDNFTWLKYFTTSFQDSVKLNQRQAQRNLLILSHVRSSATRDHIRNTQLSITYGSHPSPYDSPQQLSFYTYRNKED